MMLTVQSFLQVVSEVLLFVAQTQIVNVFYDVYGVHERADVSFE